MNLHLRVRLIAIPSVLDGRRSAFTTGYRPQFRYRGRDNDVSVTIPDDCLIEPGDSTDAFLTFYRPDLQIARIQPNSSFMLAEGGRNIAHGSVVEIIDQTMTNPTISKESVVFVDVDDTLIRSFGTKQIPIPNVVRYVREMFDAGHLLYCWSRGGANYSREVAVKLGIADCFVCFLPKPDIVLDDRLHELLNHCEFIHPNNAAPKTSGTNNPMDRSGGSA